MVTRESNTLSTPSTAPKQFGADFYCGHVLEHPFRTGITGFGSWSRAGGAETRRRGEKLHLPVIVGLQGTSYQHEAALEVFTAQDVGKAHLVAAKVRVAVEAGGGGHHHGFTVHAEVREAPAAEILPAQ